MIPLMIPVQAVGVARSFRECDVQRLATDAGLSAAEREQLQIAGLREIPVATVSLAELVTEVIEQLRCVGWDKETCTSVIFTHSLELGDVELATLDREFRETLPGLVRHPVMITGRPCSVLHLGIELAAHHQRLRPGGSALVLGADVAPTTEDRFFFGSAMGDSAVGLVLGGLPSVGHLLAVHSTYRVIACEGAESPPEEIKRFREQNPTAIRAVITAALSDAGLSWADLSAIVPHSPYRAIWDTVSALCRFPRERIFDEGLAHTGHLNSNDVLVHFDAAMRAGRLRSRDVVALVSPGFGGTRGCTVIRSS